MGRSTPASIAAAGELAPRHARPHAVGGLERVEGPALAQLAAPQGPVHLAARGPAPVGVADQGHELPQRLGHAGAHAVPEAPSSGRAYSGTSRAIAARISSVTAPSAGSISVGRARREGRARARWSAVLVISGEQNRSTKYRRWQSRTHAPLARSLIGMTKLEKRVNLAAVVLPFLATLAAIVLLWNEVVSGRDLAILAVMYVITALGITVGYHRMLTHRAFQSPQPVEYAFAVLGSMAVQGPVISWVGDHRKHHAHTDKEGDPHSPHVGHGDGPGAVFRGLWHAHAGWLMTTNGLAGKQYAKDLYEDRGMRIINRRFPLIVLAGLLLPALAGWLISGTLAGAATGLLWGGLVRIFLVHHVTWSVNSVCHFLGSRRFETDDESRNVFWLALPSFGESWHHNHHAFPRSAEHGLRRWEVDPSALVIRGARAGRPGPQRGAHRAGAAAPAGGRAPAAARQRLAS